MKKAVLLFILLFFNSCAKYNLVDFELSNGLKVICIEKKTAPVIFFSIWYKCGSKCDAPSKSGVAHYLEHMAFVSDEMEFSNILEDVGAEKNAFTALNAICFHETIPKDHIETVFFHEAKRMVRLHIEDQVFQSEKSAILEERAMRIDNNPDGELQECETANIFNRKVGGIGIIGWRHEIESLTKEDLYKFHEKWFAPNNAVVIISGDFDLKKIKTLAEKYFGKIPPKKIVAVPKKAPPSFCFKEIKYASSKNRGTFATEYVYRLPNSFGKNLRKSIALNIAVNVLNHPASFVEKILKDIFNYATISFSYINGIFPYDLISATVTSSSIDALRNSEKIWHYLKSRLLSTGISKSEADAEKRRQLISLAYRRDDIIEMSNYFGWLLMAGYSPEEIQSTDDMVQSISEKECNDVLKEALSREPTFISKSLPKGYDSE
ncbi:MAG: insulinase family protein [Holosporaceae bacterium]|nr:insulinase family protein [Holosporaceae bacterium]